MIVEIGIGIDTERKSFRIGFRSHVFHWTPGEEEFRSYVPARYFDSPNGDCYTVWSWLWFVFFYARTK